MKHEKFKIDFNEIRLSNCIIETIEKETQELAEKHWAEDKCKPKFLVSILHDYDIRCDKNNQYIILNCTHLHQTFSRIIFPRDDGFYGYEGLLDAMTCLYNQTM